MCVILKVLGNRKYGVLSFVAADTDVTSQATAVSNGSLSSSAVIHRIPRSREVGQTYISAILSTARSLVAAFSLVWRLQPRLVLCNGPGTCLPVCFAAWFLTRVGRCRTRIAFVESVCRCSNLSMTGKLLYHLRIADEILVQWPELLERCVNFIPRWLISALSKSNKKTRTGTPGASLSVCSCEWLLIPLGRFRDISLQSHEPVPTSAASVAGASAGKGGSSLGPPAAASNSSHRAASHSSASCSGKERRSRVTVSPQPASPHMFARTPLVSLYSAS